MQKFTKQKRKKQNTQKFITKKYTKFTKKNIQKFTTKKIHKNLQQKNSDTKSFKNLRFVGKFYFKVR